MGRTPLQGPRLTALAGTWLLVRLAILGACAIGPVGAMAADSLLPLALHPIIASMLLRAGNQCNYSFIVILACAAQVNLYWHLEMSDLAEFLPPQLDQRLIGVLALDASTAFLWRLVPSHLVAVRPVLDPSLRHLPLDLRPDAVVAT